jgi:hypothetical protein
MVDTNVFSGTNPLGTIRMDEFTGLGTTSGTLLSAPVLWGVVVTAVFITIVIAGCTGTSPVATIPTPAPTLIPGNHTVTSGELVFFHPVPGCDSCDQVGRFANETVNTYFSPEMAKGRLVYRDVNLNLPENREIVNRYGAYTNSLWIGVQDETGFHRTEIVDIWYYAYNREDFLQYLKGILDRQLAGTP